MVLMANLVKTKQFGKKLKKPETLAYRTHIMVLNESFPMNTNMTGLICLHSWPSDESNLGIRRVNYGCVPRIKE